MNAAERLVIGPVKRSEIVAILRSFLRLYSVFPSPGREGVLYEGSILGLNSDGAQIALSRGYADAPWKLAQRVVRRYADANDAVEAFIDLEWGCGIDGIKLKPDE